MGNYQLAKIGRFDPKKAFQAAFSPQAWLQGMAFLFSLKIGNTMAMGVPGFARLQMWLGERMQARLEFRANENSDSIPRFSTDSSMDFEPAFQAAGKP